MTPKKQEEIFDLQTAEQRDTMTRKAHDYTDAEKDVLGNFREVAAMCELPVDKVFQVFIATKFVRLRELCKGKNPLNESRADSHLDSICYNRLWDMHRREESEVNSTWANARATNANI